MPTVVVKSKIQTRELSMKEKNKPFKAEKRKIEHYPQNNLECPEKEKIHKNVSI